MMLLITYTPLTLQNGAPYSYDTPPLPPTGGDDYLSTYHSYKLPASSSTWTAAAVKSLVKSSSYLYAVGNLAMDLIWSGNTTGSDKSYGAPGEPNYMLVQGNPALQGFQARVHPPDLNDPSDAAITQYVIQSSSSILFPGPAQFTPPAAYTHTFIMNTKEVVKTFDLNLVDNTSVRVDVDANAPGFPSFPVGARAFHSIAAILPKETNEARTGTFDLNGGDGGTWGLVLDYQGNVNPWRVDPPGVTDP
jgi:hypothetical protein